MPDRLDLRALRVEAVAAEVEAVAVADLGARQASDRIARLDHHRLVPAARELVRGGDPGWTGAEDEGAGVCA
jgi:hypothetical protein